MGVQLFILIIAFFAASLFKETGSQQNCRRQRKNYITLMMILFTLQSGLRRNDVGADTGVYKQYFYETIATPWSDMWRMVIDFVKFDEGKDPGYYILTKLFGSIFPSYQLLLLGIAILFFVALGKLLYRYLKTNKEVLVALGLYQCLFF